VPASVETCTSNLAHMMYFLLESNTMKAIESDWIMFARDINMCLKSCNMNGYDYMHLVFVNI